ncbi:xylose isomerase [Salinivibrio sp. IB574]|uniref:sugar phosphate isomerase/epimerase family protein n=1 Tax=Salinivibrio sp. IB574 TaxID=1909444 RepID=UPI000988CABA|nr:sugar phosphate isomerase/epimerase [Salinivibrio sp. IB574]OOF19756.1 xylose isomerase [Salinivibrio sp. IB574]
MTEISISNIAWQTEHDAQVRDLLSQCNVSYVDIAPSKYVDTKHLLNMFEVRRVRDFWLSKDIRPLGMQSLLFGTEGLNVFGDTVTQERMLSHLERICAIGDELGARLLVFGSPRNRDCSGLGKQDIHDTAVSFFRRLGDIAKRHNVTVCLEPNPSRYNANFMTTSIETADIVMAVDHENIKMQLDTGAMCINEEVQEETLQRVKTYIGHIHISEPDLVPVYQNNLYQERLAPLIKRYFPNMPITIEMLTKESDSMLDDIEKSIRYVTELYQG